jgi:hypothetical protein
MDHTFAIFALGFMTGAAAVAIFVALFIYLEKE